MSSAGSLLVGQVLFTAVPLTIGIIHGFLFAFEPRGRRNLYFASLALTLAGIAWFDFEDMKRDADPAWVDLGPAFLIPLLLLSIGTFIYSLFYDERPRQYRVFIALILIYFTILTLDLTLARRYGILLTIAMVIEVLRVILVRYNRQGEDLLLPAIGIGLFGVFATGDMLLDLGVLQNPILGTYNPYLIGVVIMLLAMSVHLARDFARTGRRLEAELVRVTELSGMMLEQERNMRDEEVRRRVAEAQNERRGQELEEARALQLSLIPSELPEVPGLQIAASMRTATEVGGDYYDVHVDDRGAMFLIGDAVGHGARAGTLVAATKSLFTLLRDETDPAHLLEQIDQALRQMKLRRVHMALAAVRIEGFTLTASTAGTPPVVLRTASGDTRDLLTPHAPLGSMEMPFTSVRCALQPGDLVLLMSDGLPEMSGAAGELGYDGVRDLITRAGEGSANEVIENLGKVIVERLGDEPPADDITLVAIRVTGA